MNKISTIVLSIAIAILFYLHFSSKGNNSETTISKVDSAIIAKPVAKMPKEIKASKIVYVNSDVLNQKYDYVKDLTSAAQTKQGKLEGAYQTKGQKLQQDFADYQQKAESGLLSENQRAATEENLRKRKEELDAMEAELQSLMDEIQRDNEKVRKIVVDYIKDYNKNGKYDYILTYTDSPGGVILLANDGMDITDEILEGLNEQYKGTKKK